MAVFPPPTDALRSQDPIWYRKTFDDPAVSIRRFPGRESEPALSPALTDALLSMFDVMPDTLARNQLAGNPPDLLIDIPGNICQSHDFCKARLLIVAEKSQGFRAPQDKRGWLALPARTAT